ncbi:hypothetical protein [Aeromicrobium sp. Sec7.5]|uniref:hypothetical protein n=1 Tax=Aeromicrobium sp. Sec7.5 TaxID=3121276 RepID=UPI002FE4B011
MRPLVVGALALVLLLAGCGGDSVESAQAAASELGCEDAAQESSEDGETVTCTVEGNGYRIVYFTDDETLQEYRTAAENVTAYSEDAGEVLPGESGVVFGDNWGVECLDTSCEEVVEILGGERI